MDNYISMLLFRPVHSDLLEIKAYKEREEEEYKRVEQ